MVPSFGTPAPIMEPCQSADKFVFDHIDLYDSFSPWRMNESFSVFANMQVSRVKVIEQKRAYELQTLIGNSGGYIGLLLGTTFIHHIIIEILKFYYI